jgi:dCTP deaminase
MEKGLAIMAIKPDHLLYRWLADNNVIYPLVNSKIRRNDNGEKIISKGLSESGYDLSLGPIVTVVKQNPVKHFFSKWVKSWRVVLDPFNPVGMVKLPLERDDKGRLYFDIPPNSFCLGNSAEYLRMPSDHIAFAFGKSTYARDGMGMPMTPLEAGWQGHVTIEIANLTRYWNRIYVDMGICQIVFLALDGDVLKPYDGIYQGQPAIPISGQIY